MPPRTTRSRFVRFVVDRAVAVGVVGIVTGVVVGAGDCPFWPDHDAPAPDGPGLFIAQNADFAALASWPSLIEEGAVDGGHVATPRTIRVSALPDADATEFAVGTIIVKEGVVDGGDEIHAMVKRGGGFNARGARDWEFFELQRDAEGTPLIAWRGEEPPAGQGYGCISGSCTDTTTTSCNACHASADDNDAILSPTLVLGALDPRWFR